MQRLHLAGQRVAAPAEEFCGFLAVAVGLAHRDADQGLLELGQRAIQQRGFAGPELTFRPAREASGPVLRGPFLQRAAAHLGRNVLRAYDAAGRGYGQGFGFYVRVDEGHAYFLGNVGEFYKGGAGGTVFWVDPKEDFVAVFMITLPALRNHFQWQNEE